MDPILDNLDSDIEAGLRYLEEQELLKKQKAVEEAAKAVAEEQARADAYAKMAVVKPTLMPTMQPQSRSVMPKIPSFFNLA